MSNQETHPTPDTPTEPKAEPTRQQRRKGKRKRAKYLAKEIQVMAKNEGKRLTRKHRRTRAFLYVKREEAT